MGYRKERDCKCSLPATNTVAGVGESGNINAFCDSFMFAQHMMERTSSKGREVLAIRGLPPPPSDQETLVRFKGVSRNPPETRILNPKLRESVLNFFLLIFH